ncbi:aldehyde dehydrogenase family protein [Oceanobacillus longus]|uniref:Aldehyde dehydrogenase family protein n=1 Tax=Oceanobacillus longus TaxID=930120 RepID=A0ABV8GW12_9BACI
MNLITKEYSMTINGELVFTKETIPVINPANEEIVAQAPKAMKGDLDYAVKAARKAFIGWSNLPIEERANLLEQFADALLNHKEELANIFTLEMGRPLDGVFGSKEEISAAATWFKEVAQLRLTREIIEENEEHYVEKSYTPVGVTGLIIPWNFPVLLATWKISQALLVGNTIIVKPSPYTPLTTLKLGEIANSIFPKGVFNVVNGQNELGQWMTEHPDIDKISFTGSTETGKKVLQSSAGNLKRVTLELGGNDPAIILEDANPKVVAEQLFWGAFLNNGQVCIAAKRIYVHENVYDEFLSEFVQYAKNITVGDGMDPNTMIGPLQNKMQYEKVKDLIENTKQTGANIVLGGVIEDNPGYFIPITIVDNPPESSRVVTEEAFGPIVPVIKYKDYEEVILKANNTIHGLGASVWGEDTELLNMIAERLEAGTVWINEIQVNHPNYPFGGIKQSGLGVESGIEGLKEFTNRKVTMVKKK